MSTELITDSGNRRVFINISSLSEHTYRGIRQGFFQIGHDLVRTAKRDVLKKPKSGRTYLIRRGKTRRRHVASAPGESPANISGKYRKSIGFKIKGSSQLIFGAGSPSVEYAKFLEKGTSKMEPRPGLGNAVKATERNARQYFVTGIERSIGK